MKERHFIIDQNKEVVGSTTDPERAKKAALAVGGTIIFRKENNALHKAKQEREK